MNDDREHLRLFYIFTRVYNVLNLKKNLFNNYNDIVQNKIYHQSNTKYKVTKNINMINNFDLAIYLQFRHIR